MDIRKLQRAIVDGLEEVKAQNIAVFNTEHLTPLFERVIIASGTSNRQTRSLAASVRDAVKASGFPVLRTEGEDNGEWIIVDCGAAVAHIMQPGIRDYYHLEELWGTKPVRMKLDAASAGAPKPRANGTGNAAAKQAAPKRKPATRTTMKPSATSKAGTKKAAPKPAVPRRSATGKPGTRPASTKPAGARKAAPGKAAAKKKPRA